MLGSYHYDIAYTSSVGNIRKVNQDSLIVRRGKIGDKEFALLAVADGMGGLSHGEKASGAAIQALDQWWQSRLAECFDRGLNWEQLRNSLSVLIDKINWDIYTGSEGADEKSGTTLTATFLYQDQYCIFQVGDSRAYKITSNGISQITKDQTYVQREVDAGRMTCEEALVHPMRHVLVSTLGVITDYTMELFSGKLDPAEGLLLCSDGFYNEMSASWYQGFSQSNHLQELLSREEHAIYQGVASDNLTAILIRLNRGKR